MMQAVREAALRPAAAELYPFLPARMWTAAAHLTELVARYRGICAKAAYRSNRVLSDAHFMFRGGERKRGAVRQPKPKLARWRDERSWLTAPSPEATQLDQQLSDRRIVVLRAPTAGVQK
jgi:hypothetical protein